MLEFYFFLIVCYRSKKMLKKPVEIKEVKGKLIRIKKIAEKIIRIEKSED